MIFVTVGTQLPFDRLIKTIDEWAKYHEEDIFAQVGKASYIPKNIQYADYISLSKAERLFENADVIVSHAGMGSILTALKYQKPIILLPRLASRGEHRNDHQVATAKWMVGKSGITVAWNEDELTHYLDQLELLEPGESIKNYASEELIMNLKSFLNDRRVKQKW